MGAQVSVEEQEKEKQLQEKSQKRFDHYFKSHSLQTNKIFSSRFINCFKDAEQSKIIDKQYEVTVAFMVSKDMFLGTTKTEDPSRATFCFNKDLKKMQLQPHTCYSGSSIGYFAHVNQMKIKVVNWKNDQTVEALVDFGNDIVLKSPTKEEEGTTQENDKEKEKENKQRVIKLLSPNNCFHCCVGHEAYYKHREWNSHQNGNFAHLLVYNEEDYNEENPLLEPQINASAFNKRLDEKIEQLIKDSSCSSFHTASTCSSSSITNSTSPT